MGFQIEDKKLKRAGLDYWDKLDIRYYDGLPDFFAKNAGPFYYFTTKGRHRYTDVSYPDGAYLVFGREDKGLPEPLLKENPGSCRADADAADAAEFKPFQLGRDCRLRGAAAVGFPRDGDRGAAAYHALGRLSGMIDACGI